MPRAWDKLPPVTAKQHARDKARAEVALRVAFQSRDGFEHVGTTRDLSVRGASVETPHPPPEGATIDSSGIMARSSELARTFRLNPTLRVFRCS